MIGTRIRRVSKVLLLVLMGTLIGCGSDPEIPYPAVDTTVQAESGEPSEAVVQPDLNGLGTEPVAERDENDMTTAIEPKQDAPYLRVLGTAQDGGFPHAACSCKRCDLARRDPTVQRFVASLGLVVPAANKVFLIDATPDIRKQIDLLADVRNPPYDRVDRAPVDGILLTHAHIGHYLGLAFFGFEAVHTKDLPLWATPKMIAFLKRNGPWSQLIDLGNLRPIAIGEAGFELGVSTTDGSESDASVRVEALKVPHRDEFSDTVAFRLIGPQKTVLYVPDTDAWTAWNPPLLDVLETVDIALLDGTFYSLDELPGRSIEEVKHPLITLSMDLLEERVRAGRLEVFFTHLNHSNPALDPSSEASQVIEQRGFAVLRDGQEIPI